MSTRPYGGLPWRLAIGLGALVSTVVTAIFTVWDWWANPGGIFRDVDRTHWPIVYETAISWLIPTFAWVAVLVVVGYWLGSRVRARSSPSRSGLGD